MNKNQKEVYMRLAFALLGIGCFFIGQPLAGILLIVVSAVVK
jgi:hypothetical protein